MEQLINTTHSPGIIKTGISRTTLCTAAHGSLKQGFLEPETKTRGSLLSESVDNCLECLQDVWQYGCEVLVLFSLHGTSFPSQFFILVCIEFVLGPLFCSEFICFPTNMCISWALKLSLQTMPPYQCSGGVISALMCPGLG